MRPEVLAAFVIGILLPLLETLRRGWAHWHVHFATMLEDYLAGALLLLGGWLALRTRARPPLLLTVAWAYVTGMMTGSLLGQIDETIGGVDLEPNNGVVLAVKVGLWGTAVMSLVLSARSLRIPR
jgi:hypothetical protein